MRPIIGVTSNFGHTHDTDPPREQSYLLAAYSDAVFRAGGLAQPTPVPAAFDLGLIDELIQSYDGLAFTGGFDLHPRNYGQPVHPRTIPLPERRDRFEVELFRRADALGVPIFAICLGHQIAHICRGGQMLQHVDDLRLQPRITHHLPHDRNAFHTVRIEPDSALASIVGTTELEVTSRHHQVIDMRQTGRGLRSTAFAPDGLLEASEDMDGRFLLCVQWHPEDVVDRPEHLALFEALVEAAGAWREQKRRAPAANPTAAG